MRTSFQVNVVVRCKEVLYYILLHDGTAEPLRVSPPEAVAYLLELREDAQCGEIALQDGLGVLKTHPLFDHRRVDTAEVRRRDQIAIVVQLVETRVLAVQPAFDGR